MDFEIRGDRTPQGPRKLSREREAYSRLVQQGYSNTEACRIVGVDRRTGNKWRNGRYGERNRKPVPPMHVVGPASGPSRYLRVDERIHIADRLMPGSAGKVSRPAGDARGSRDRLPGALRPGPGPAAA
ncbi:hypothetical protein ACE1SV_69820 [Streptomyces sp. E-15]